MVLLLVRKVIAIDHELLRWIDRKNPAGGALGEALFDAVTCSERRQISKIHIPETGEL